MCDRMGVLVRGRLVKTFARKDFEESAERELHLLLPPVSGEQQAALGAFPGRLDSSPDGAMFSVPAARLMETAAILGRLGIEIRGTRTTRLSLEELFIETVEGVAS